MKKSITLFIAVILLTSVAAQSLTHVIGQPTGFASMNGGTTGGEGGPVVTVTNADELKAAVDGSNDATIILVSGTINVGSEMSARGNKTIVGLGTDARIAGGGFGWNTKSNVIVQNITFEDASDDLLKINNKCKNFWIDHCTFSDGASTNSGSHDGMLDITRGSEFVTVSYCRFFNHDKNILIGHSDSESGDVIMKVTLHHNWFDGTVQRNPRVRYATVHCFNNYHVNNRIYGVASACNANVLVENSYFKDTQIPLQVGVPGFSPAGYLVQRGCYFENCGTPQLNEKDMTGLFPYEYSLDSVMYVPCIAETYVGAGKPHKTAENFDCEATDPGGNGGGDEEPDPDEDGYIWVKNNFFQGDADANGWFWFNDQEKAGKYMNSMITLFDSQSSSGVTSTLQVEKAGAGTDGTAGSTGAIIGCLDLGKSATKSEYTGGSVVFELPSCGEFQFTSSRTGDNLLKVQTATSAAGPFTDVYTYSSAKGIATVNATQYVQTENPVWVKIINGSTGSLNIHGVKISSYEKILSSTKIVKEGISALNYHQGVLTFKHEKTAPAEIRISNAEGKTIDIPFRGWVEAGVENRLQLNMNHLNKGVYLLMMNTNEGVTTLKISK